MDRDINAYIKQEFDIKDVDIRTYSPLALAYIGDCIFDLVIRTAIVNRGNARTNDLHRHASAIVKAHSQALMIEALEGELSEEEMSVYRRGRNAKSATTAKNATVSDYRKATGFEALLGYLYLQGNIERVVELSKRGMELTGMTV